MEQKNDRHVPHAEILVRGEVVSVPLVKFERTLSLEGTPSTVPQQRRKCSVGNVVKVGGSVGVLSYTVLAVSSDGRSWRDEDGAEHGTWEILL